MTRPKAVDKQSKHKSLTFWAIEDIKQVCQRFKELGGTVFRAPKKDGPFTSATVEDPWGNKLGLHSILF